MNKTTMLYLEIGLLKELYDKKIITEQEMNLAISEINEDLLREEM